MDFLATRRGHDLAGALEHAGTAWRASLTTRTSGEPVEYEPMTTHPIETAAYVIIGIADLLLLILLGVALRRGWGRL